jgi:excisionase family DNA binding protein
MLTPKLYTPAQAAEILQISKNTIYELIERGEILAKKIGKFYRVPVSSLSFAFTGLDDDLFLAEKEDLKNIAKVERAIAAARKNLK